MAQFLIFFFFIESLPQHHRCRHSIPDVPVRWCQGQSSMGQPYVLDLQRTPRCRGHGLWEGQQGTLLWTVGGCCDAYRHGNVLCLRESPQTPRVSHQGRGLFMIIISEYIACCIWRSSHGYSIKEQMAEYESRRLGKSKDKPIIGKRAQITPEIPSCQSLVNAKSPIPTFRDPNFKE